MPEESTTPDLVELTRRAVEASNAGDIDAAMSFCAHDAVYDARRVGLRLEGREAIRGFLEQWRSVYEEVKIEVPDGRVVALIRQSARGRQSGVPIVVHFFVLHTIRDGKMRKIEYFRHRADALRAAGLGE